MKLAPPARRRPEPGVCQVREPGIGVGAGASEQEDGRGRARARARLRLAREVGSRAAAHQEERRAHRDGGSLRHDRILNTTATNAVSCSAHERRGRESGGRGAQGRGRGDEAHGGHRRLRRREPGGRRGWRRDPRALRRRAAGRRRGRRDGRTPARPQGGALGAARGGQERLPLRPEGQDGVPRVQAHEAAGLGHEPLGGAARLRRLARAQRPARVHDPRPHRLRAPGRSSSSRSSARTRDRTPSSASTGRALGGGGEKKYGTTNIDFSDALHAGVQRMRSYRADAHRRREGRGEARDRRRPRRDGEEGRACPTPGCAASSRCSRRAPCRARWSASRRWTSTTCSATCASTATSEGRPRRALRAGPRRAAAPRARALGDGADHDGRASTPAAHAAGHPRLGPPPADARAAHPALRRAGRRAPARIGPAELLGAPRGAPHLHPRPLAASPPPTGRRRSASTCSCPAARPTPGAAREGRGLPGRAWVAPAAAIAAPPGSTPRP